jgi:Protein of unknown function (DUF3800)
MSAPSHKMQGPVFRFAVGLPTQWSDGKMPTVDAGLRAYVDESGQRAATPASSPCFVLTAVVFAEERESDARQLLEQIRADLQRKPGDTLHWKNFKSHAHRVRASQLIGTAQWLTVSTVVVCKRHLGDDVRGLDEDKAYMYTFRLLLERLMWIAKRRQRPVDVTLAHVRRFPIAKLREYESRLRAVTAASDFDWSYIHGPCSIDQPSRVEFLQMADICASATAAAFNPDHFSNTEERYVREFLSRFYRSGHPPRLISYGLKMHPWNASTQGAYPWVERL